MSQQVDDPEHFSNFKEVLSNAIAKYGHANEKDLAETRKKLVEGLDALELEFQKTVRSCYLGEVFYNAFLDHILNVKKNVLTARPFFRERKIVFVSKISELIKTRDWTNLSYYHINFHFIGLVTRDYNWQTKEELAVKKIVDKIKATRQELVVTNMPLVINRATIFWNRTHKSHLSFMDLVQIGVEGLTSAIDKYCGRYNKVWPGVVIGRCTGNYIHNYSDTMLHFYPADKRVLYRANKFRARHPHGDYSDDDLVNVINLDQLAKTDINAVSDLLAAASVVSCDTRPPLEDDTGDNLSHYEAPDSWRPDVRFTEKESVGLMQKCLNKLPLVDRKLLRLKGLTISL